MEGPCEVRYGNFPLNYSVSQIPSLPAWPGTTRCLGVPVAMAYSSFTVIEKSQDHATTYPFWWNSSTTSGHQVACDPLPDS